MSTTSTTPAGSPSAGAGAAPSPLRQPERFEPLALLAAAAIPGLGHIVLGEVRRGVLIAAGVLGLFFGGMFIGGIDVVDRQEDGVWFLGQALVGPIAFATDYIHQSQFKVRDQVLGPDPRDPRRAVTRDITRTRRPDENPGNSKSLGRMNELGTLFSAIAGMLNLIAVIDAGYHGKARKK